MPASVARKSRTAVPKTTSGILVHVDPRSLLSHPGNLRTDLGDLAELEASIAANGVVQALTLLPDGVGYRILAGHRRAAAAAAVLDSGRWPDGRPATVPGLVRTDLVDAAADQVAVMLVENDADQRIPLTMTERAAGYAQLAAFDLDAAEIGRRVGKSTTHVAATLGLSGMSSAVQANADAGRLSLEDVAALTEFEDDPKAVTRILQDAATSWGIKHRMADERRKRADATATRNLRAELDAAGVTVVAKPKGWPYNCAAARPEDLIDPATREAPDRDAVRASDGFAAFIDTAISPPKAVVICLDPAQRGYIRTTHTSYRSPDQIAAAEAAHEAKQARLAALDDAATIRRRFLVETYGTAKAAKVLFVEAVRAAVEDPDRIDRGDADLVQALAGGDIRATGEAKLDRLSRLLVARWIAGQEDNLAMLTRNGPGWRRDPAAALAWLDRLVEAGYELAAAEAEARAEIEAALVQDQQDDGDDVDEGIDDEVDEGVANDSVDGAVNGGSASSRASVAVDQEGRADARPVE